MSAEVELPRVLVTGGTGFVGNALLRRLVRDGQAQVLATVRHPSSVLPEGVIPLAVDLLQEGAVPAPLIGIDAVVHCAARVHVMHDNASDPLVEFRKVNVDWTLLLARLAAAAKVRRFVFVSSVKVNGEETVLGHPFTAEDVLAPSDPYGISKMEAEQGLRSVAAETGLELVIVRPPLVYGPGVRANFRALMRLLDTGLPLPLGGGHNKRSLVALDNLVDLLVTTLSHPAAAHQTFMVSDCEDLSTSDLLRRLAHALGRQSRLVRCPAGLLRFAAAAIGKSNAFQRLLGSLQVDALTTCDRLDWRPPVSVDEGLRKTAEYFRETGATNDQAPI